MSKLPKQAREFLTALILRAPIEPAEVSLEQALRPKPRKAEFDGKNPRLPNNPSYMRGWNAVKDRKKR